MNVKYESNKEKNIKLKNILQKKEVLLKQELANKIFSTFCMGK